MTELKASDFLKLTIDEVFTTLPNGLDDVIPWPFGSEARMSTLPYLNCCFPLVIILEEVYSLPPNASFFAVMIKCPFWRLVF